MEHHLMFFNLILASLSFMAIVFIFYFVFKMSKNLDVLTHQVEIKGVKLDIIENLLSVGIYVADADGKWSYVNNTLAVMLGMQPAQMVGNGWLRNIVNKDAVYNKWINSIENQLPHSDIIQVNIAGRKTQFEINTLPVLTDGKYSAYVGTIKPILET
jgi:PAS domain S-box-containing protein